MAAMKVLFYDAVARLPMHRGDLEFLGPFAVAFGLVVVSGAAGELVRRQPASLPGSG